MDETLKSERAKRRARARDGGPGPSDWLDDTLIKSLPFSEAASEAERAEQRAAARAAVAEIAPPEAGLTEKLLAVRLVCAHASAMHWQARAMAPGQSDDERVKAQELACDFMELSTRQVSALADFQAERRRGRKAAERAARQRARKAEPAGGPAPAGGKPRVLH